MRQNIHYFTATGEIAAWDTANRDNEETSYMANCSLLKLDVPDVVNFMGHKVYKGELVEYTPDEIWQRSLPQDYEVKGRISIELDATDCWMVPDRPLKADVREAWQTYRQALRDLSKDYSTPVEQIANWPTRPDGHDIIADVRQRLVRKGT